MARPLAQLGTRRGEISAGALTVEVEFDPLDRLCSVRLPRNLPPGVRPDDLKTIIRQMESHPLRLEGSPPFFQKCWQRMRKIQWGKTLTYGELASLLRNPNASRAVGGACAANPFLLVVPCHRVLGAHGLGGFAYGLPWKAKLLELETSPSSRPS